MMLKGAGSSQAAVGWGSITFTWQYSIEELTVRLSVLTRLALARHHCTLKRGIGGHRCPQPPVTVITLITETTQE